MGNKVAVNRLDDDERGSKVVTETATGTSDVVEVPVVIGGPSRTRTLDPLIKRHRLRLKAKVASHLRAGNTRLSMG